MDSTNRLNLLMGGTYRVNGTAENAMAKNSCSIFDPFCWRRRKDRGVVGAWNFGCRKCLGFPVRTAKKKLKVFGSVNCLYMLVAACLVGLEIWER